MSVTSIPITGPISYTVLPYNNSIATGPISIRINSDNADEFLKSMLRWKNRLRS